MNFAHGIIRREDRLEWMEDIKDTFSDYFSREVQRYKEAKT